MSFSSSLLSSAASPSVQPQSGILGHRQISVLSSLLYEKGHELYSKAYDTRTHPFTVNEISIAIIQAYASRLEARLGGNPLKSTHDILRERGLSVVFSIKGSTVPKLLLDHEAPSLDLDTSLEFDQIPIPASIGKDPDSIKAFFSTYAGTLFLREFYYEVSYESTKRLLWLDNLKTMMQYRASHKVDPPSELLKSEAQINMLKDKFFNNLLLFSGNTTFLITFGTIDFAIKVPFMSSSSSLHLADSLEMHVPVHPFTCHLVSDQVTLRSPYSADSAIDLLRQKIIQIVEPQKIQYNGFERIIYALTQGWSIPEKAAFYVLLQELFIRTTPEAQMTMIPFDRFYALLLKKKTVSGIGEVFCLRMFLNAYMAALEYVEDGAPEAIKVGELFQEAFLRPDYKSLFPSYVKEGFSNFGDLDILVALERLNLQIQCKNPSQLTLVTHLGKPSFAMGSFNKQHGCLVAKAMNIQECLAQLEMLRLHMTDDMQNLYFAESFKMFGSQALALDDKMILVLFMNHILLGGAYPHIQEDLERYKARVLELLLKNPNLLLHEDFRLGFVKLAENTLSGQDLSFIINIAGIESNAPIVVLFYKILSSFEEESIKSSILESLSRDQDPVVFSKLINFLLALEDDEIAPERCLKIIEQGFKARGQELPLPLFIHPKMPKMLARAPIGFAWDKPLWISSFCRLLPETVDEQFYQIYYNMSSQDAAIFESTIALLPIPERFTILKRLIKDQKDDLIFILLTKEGMPFFLADLFSQDPLVFKSKALKKALIALPESLFCYNIEAMITRSETIAQHVILALLEHVELHSKFIPICDVLAEWSLSQTVDPRILMFALKLLNAMPFSDRRSFLTLMLSSSLDLSEKPIAILFKQLADKWGASWLRLESSDDATIREAVIAAKHRSIHLSSTGLHFASPWGLECEALKWYSKTVEECIADFGKKPSDALILAMHQRLMSRSSPLDEPFISRLKTIFSPYQTYLVGLFRHIGRYHVDAVKEKYAKELAPLISDEGFKLEFFQIYVDCSDSFKHLSSLLSFAALQAIDQSSSIDLLDRLFAKANDDIKISILHRFKDVSCLRHDKVDLLFEFFKRISTPSLRTNGLIDFFFTSFVKLAPSQQHELLFAPLIAEESGRTITHKPLIEKSKSDIKALETLSMILTKRGQEGFAVAPAELLGFGEPILNHLLINYNFYESRHQDVIQRFVEKLFAVYKQHNGRIPLKLFDSLVEKLSSAPIYDVVLECVLIDLDILSCGAIAHFLTKRKDYTRFCKADSEKFQKLFKHLANHYDLATVYDLYRAYFRLDCFQDMHKKEMIGLLCEKAILENKSSILTQVLGTKASLGFREEKSGELLGINLKESSKAAKKSLFEALEHKLEEASDLIDINNNALIPLKLISEAFGDETFIDLKSKTRHKIVNLILANTNAAKNIAELDGIVLKPFKTMLSYFEPGKDIEELYIAILSRFLAQGESALEDTNQRLEGFAHLLIPLRELASVKHVPTGDLLISLSKEALLDVICQILVAKTSMIDADISLLQVVNKLRDLKSDLIVPFLKKIAFSHPSLIINFIETQSNEQAAILIKAVRQAPSGLYFHIAEILASRAPKETVGSLLSFAHQFIGINQEFSIAFIKVLKRMDKEALYADILSSRFEVFTHMLSKYFDTEVEKDEIIQLLERRRKHEGLNFFAFCMKLKSDPFNLQLYYIKQIPDEIKDEFFSELEANRQKVGNSFIRHSDTLHLSDPAMARFYFNYLSDKNPGAIIDELRSVDFINYFSSFLKVYNYWIVPGKYTDTYPIILEDTLERIQRVVDQNRAEGELDMLTLNSLLECVNCLCLSYHTTLEATGYPMGERFNPVFLQALACIMQPINLLKNQLGFLPVVYATLRSIKHEQFLDLSKPEYLELIDTCLRSLLRFSVVDVKEYFKKGDLSKIEYEAYSGTMYLTIENAKLNYLMLIIQKWMPLLIDKKIDVFAPFIASIYQIDQRLMSVDLKKAFFSHVKVSCRTYLDELKSGYAPSLPESCVHSYLQAFDPKKADRYQKDAAAASGFFARSKEEMDDFVYHACMIKIKEATHVIKHG